MFLTRNSFRSTLIGLLPFFAAVVLLFATHWESGAEAKQSEFNDIQNSEVPLAPMAAGDILVIDFGHDAVISIDPANGNRPMISAGLNASGGALPRGSGGRFTSAQDVVLCSG